MTPIEKFPIWFFETKRLGLQQSYEIHVKWHKTIQFRFDMRTNLMKTYILFYLCSFSFFCRSFISALIRIFFSVYSNGPSCIFLSFKYLFYTCVLIKITYFSYYPVFSLHMLELNTKKATHSKGSLEKFIQPY